MPTKAVIFDMDGVLVDSHHAHFESWRKLAGEEGVEFSWDTFAATFGRTSRDIIKLVWNDPSLTDVDLADLDDRKEAYYRDIIAADFPVMDGAIELIDGLVEAGFALAIGSSGPPENVDLVLEKLDRREAFASIVNGLQVTRGKPHPQVFQIAAEQLGLVSGNCLVIEDAPAGIEAAHAAGMACIGLVSTGRTTEELSDADLVVTSLRELTPKRISSVTMSHHVR